MELLVLCALAYFAPGLLAIVRNHHNAGAIFVLNLFVGWTFVGWIASLVWSATAVRRYEY